MKKSFLLGFALVLSSPSLRLSAGPIDFLKGTLNTAASYWPSDRLTVFNYSSVPVVIGSIIWPLLAWKRNHLDTARFETLFVTENGLALKVAIYLPLVVSSLYAAAIFKLNQPFANSPDFVVNCYGERIPFDSMYKTPEFFNVN